MEDAAPRPPWYYGIAAVLFALFLFGPFAFPLLWKSPRFSSFWKILLTLIFTAATVLMIASTWQLVSFMIEEIKRVGSI